MKKPKLNKIQQLIMEVKIKQQRCPRCDVRGYNHGFKIGCCWYCAFPSGAYL